jgi:hypothetical protein
MDYSLISTDEHPQGWIVIKISKENEQDIYKVFASWRGGYLNGDSWKINSGIKFVEETEDEYIFHGYSGSRYFCKKTYYGVCSGYAGSVLDGITKQINKQGYEVEELPATFDYLKLNHEDVI